jgi:dTDP-4-dehydrorhamnose 3,5-epimerase
MIFSETTIRGAFVIDPERFEDERGFFARTYCEREFEAHGLATRMVQCSVSHNEMAGTLRGLHYSVPPHAEDKLVRCARGRIYDVILDLRPDSPSYRRWIGVELSAENQRMLYVPAVVAHGFQTLEPDTDVFYQMSEFYDPACARGVRWNDPAFGIAWPLPTRTMSERDRELANFRS